MRDDPGVHVVDKTIVMMLPEGLAQGPTSSAIASPRRTDIRSRDRMVFSIGAATGSAGTHENAGAVNGLIWLARIGVFLGLFVGCGGAFFASWIGRGRGRVRGDLAALVVGLFSASASLGLQGLDLLGLPLGGFLTAAPWKAAAATSLFQSLLIAVVAMTAGIVAMRSRAAGIAATLSAFALVGVGLSLASSGHAASASPQWLTRPAGVFPWRGRRLLGGRAGAAGGDGVATGAAAAAGLAPVLGAAMLVVAVLVLRA